MNELEIRLDERRRICAQEGHREIETTTLGSPELTYLCARCGATRTEARDEE